MVENINIIKENIHNILLKLKDLDKITKENKELHAKLGKEILSDEKRDRLEAEITSLQAALKEAQTKNKTLATENTRLRSENTNFEKNLAELVVLFPDAKKSSEVKK